MSNRQTSITIDSTVYNVQIIGIAIEGEFLYKYAERTEDGDLKSEGIGYYENQSITFRGDQDSDFVNLYQTLSELQSDGTFNHTTEVFSPLGNYNFEMYPNRLGVELEYIDQDDGKWWGEMSVKFTAVSKKV